MKGIDSAVKEAKKIRTKFAPTEKVIDLYRLASQNGIKIEEEAFDDKLSGLLVKKKNEYIIGVNRHHSETRKRFTIAHELAHFFLHKDNLHYDYSTNKEEETMPLVYMRADGVISSDETEANHFAAELLMPEELLLEDFRCSCNVFELARLYKVSEQAMTYRLTTLRLI